MGRDATADRVSRRLCGTDDEGAAWLAALKAPARESRLTEAAPGPPPRPGLVWSDDTHRWRHPETGAEHEHPGHRDVPGAAWRARLTPDELRAVERVQGGAWVLNRYLRSGDPDPETAKTAAHLDAAIAKSPGLRADSTLYRALDFDDPAAAEQFLADKPVGAEFADGGYGSTSTDPDYVKGFWHGREGPRAVRLDVRAPAGAPGAYLSEGGAKHLAHESEFLLARGSRFKVLAREPFGAGGTRLVVQLLAPARESADPLATLFGTALLSEAFTGVDSHGHHWVNGKQVKKGDAENEGRAKAGAAAHAKVRTAMDAVGIPHAHLSDEELHAHLERLRPKEKAAPKAAEPIPEADAKLAADLMALRSAAAAGARDTPAAAFKARAEAAVAGLSLDRLNNVLAAMGYKAKQKSAAAARALVVSSVMSVRTAIDRSEV